ncbi:MAG TPA: 30S ribosomal protein S2 [Candidatus Thermoplasmatota archaeon]|nr:30S ribosomal protein S2 [Candidatus Thermoplasmatota archaeon]
MSDEAFLEPQQSASSAPPGTELLVPEEEYLTSGVHIGTQHKTADMKPYIFRVRNDGLFVLDVAKTDIALRSAAQTLAKYDPKRILFVSQRQYGQKPVKEAAMAVGATAIAGRFMPGSLTNPLTPNFMEPEILVLTDPLGDAQAMREALNIKVPIIGLCDSNNEVKNLNIVIPANNKGRRSLALVYWLLAREILVARGELADRSAFGKTVDDFEASL